MTQNTKIWFATALGVAIILLLGGGAFVLIQRHNNTEIPRTTTPSTDSTSSTLGTSLSTIPSGNNQDEPLGASAGSGSSISSGTNGSEQANGQDLGQATSPAPAKQQNPFDPSTFAQYDKYKDGSSALAAEVQAGTGATLENGKKAAVYYRGWLTNGTLFDESRPDQNGQLQTFSFTLGAHQVIPGWEQALAGMKVGAVRLLVIPPAVGYGSSGQGSIPPNSVLVFQVQLVAVE